METLRHALRRFGRSVTIISSRQADVPYAMTATAVSELSLDPPTMLVCVNESSTIHPVLAAGADFAINILDAGQADIASRCAGRDDREGRFAADDWDISQAGVPVLKGALATILCKVGGKLDFGTHGAFVGEVVEVRCGDAMSPLLYFDGAFRSLEPLPTDGKA